MWIKLEIGRGAVWKTEFGPQGLENFCLLIWEAIWTVDWDTEQDCPCHLTVHGYKIDACRLKPLNFEVICYRLLSAQEVAGSHSQNSLREWYLSWDLKQYKVNPVMTNPGREKFQHADKDAKVGTGLACLGNWMTVYEAGWYKGLSGRRGVSRNCRGIKQRPIYRGFSKSQIRNLLFTRSTVDSPRRI